MHKNYLFSVAISLATVFPATLVAETITTQPAATQNATTKTKTSAQQAWLGIGLKPVPDTLKSQLSNIIPTGQGVMVASIAAKSPAQRAGLQQYDIIISYADQKLYSPQQLVSLIKAAQPNSIIDFNIVRQGQRQTLAVTLGKREITTPKQHTSPSYQSWPMQPIMPLQPPTTQNNTSALAWDSFQNVQVKTLADGRYHAEVSYKTPQGDEKSFTFEGKRDEIMTQINQQKDLPNDKKQALLSALNMKPSDAFNQPFFQQGFPFMSTPHLHPFFPTLPAPTKPSATLQGEAL